MNHLRDALIAYHRADDALDTAKLDVAYQTALTYHDESMPVSLDQDSYVTLASCGSVGLKITRHFVDVCRADDASHAVMALFDGDGLRLRNGTTAQDLLPGLSGIYLALGSDEGVDRSMVADMLVAVVAYTDVASEARRA